MTNDEILANGRESLALVLRKLAIARKDSGYDQRLRLAVMNHNQLIDQLSGATPTAPEYITMAESNDKSLMRLPHPIRSVQLCRADIMASFLLGPEVATDVAALAKFGASVNEVLYYVENLDDDQIQQFMAAQLRAGCVENDGGLSSMVYPVYYDATAGRMFEFTSDLTEALSLTDVGGDVPAQFLRAPAPVCYLHFGDQYVDFPLVVSNRESGDHKLEGVYIVENQVETIAGHQDGFKELGINPDAPCRILNLMFVGRPKSGLLDDSTFHMTVYVQDESMSVSELVDRHMRHYTNADTVRLASVIPGYVSPPNEERLGEYVDLLNWLTKALLYLNTADVRRQMLAERSDLAKRLSEIGPKKAAKVKRAMMAAYDRIMIMPTETLAPSVRGDHHARTNRPHFRRGHIRMQAHGEGHKLRRPVFIKPMLINKAMIGAEHAQIKAYRVK